MMMSSMRPPEGTNGTTMKYKSVHEDQSQDSDKTFRVEEDLPLDGQTEQLKTG